MIKQSFHQFSQLSRSSNVERITRPIPRAEGGNREGKVREECIGDKKEPRESYSIRLGQAERRELLVSFLRVFRDRGDA